MALRVGSRITDACCIILPDGHLDQEAEAPFRRLSDEIAELSKKRVENLGWPVLERIDPRVRRTRKLLDDAFRELITERPYGEISVADVAERATVNRATFYAHYEDKRHLATTLLRRDFETVLLARLAPEAPLGADTLCEVAEAAFEFMGRLFTGCPKHPDDFSTTVGSTLQKTIQDLVSAWIDRDPRSMAAFPGVRRETVESVIAWSLFGGAVHWSEQARRPPARHASDQIVAMIFRP